MLRTCDIGLLPVGITASILSTGVFNAYDVESATTILPTLQSNFVFNVIVDLSVPSVPWII